MAKGHKTRKHAQWSASATARNWLCPGNIALAQDLVERPEGYAAAWGTACHEVAEGLLSHKVDRLGEVIETDRHVITVDQEMIDVAYIYADYIRSRLRVGFNIYRLEQELSLERLNLGMEAGGIADCVLYNANNETLEVVDLKTGKGMFVDAENNAQMRFYALGALLAMDLDPTPVSHVITTIVQPRYASRHGTIRDEKLHVGELYDWAIDLDEHVRDAATALADYKEARGNAIHMETWVDRWLNPGEAQCAFCPAAGGCPALRRRAMEIAGVWHDDEGMHLKSNQFAENDVEGVEADLDMFESLEAWIRERRALAHTMAAQGYQFDHWSLVEKIGHRKYTVPDEEVPAAVRARIPVADEDLFEKKLRSPAGLEKTLGKGVVALHLEDIIHRPVTGTDLIRSTSTRRVPVGSLADRFFVEGVE